VNAVRFRVEPAFYGVETVCLADEVAGCLGFEPGARGNLSVDGRTRPLVGPE